MNVAVKGIAWQRDGRELLTLGEDSEVYVWDVQKEGYAPDGGPVPVIARFESARAEATLVSPPVDTFPVKSSGKSR
jgi:hypothetical protein